VPWNLHTGSGPLPGRSSDMPYRLEGASVIRQEISKGHYRNLGKDIMQR